MVQRWPDRIWIIRHGESAGNVARVAADKAGLARIDIAERDVDVPLSDLGHEQAEALGAWFAAKPENERPEVLVSSPYVRARQTSDIIRRSGGLTQDAPATFLDERLREKEFGILDRLTATGIRELHPEQFEFRRVLGKFYHRPPAGESWADVILRLRSAVDTISLHHSGKRVVIVAHQVVVLCMRYLLENLDEEQILAIDRKGDVANCAITEYAFDPTEGPDGAMTLQRYNFVAPLERAGAPVTDKPDAAVAVR